MFNKLVLLALLFTTTLFAQIDFQNAMIYKADINSKTAYEMQQNGVMIIDVRTKREFNTLRAKNSINIPVFFMNKMEKEFLIETLQMKYIQQ